MQCSRQIHLCLPPLHAARSARWLQASKLFLFDWSCGKEILMSGCARLFVVTVVIFLLSILFTILAASILHPETFGM